MIGKLRGIIDEVSEGYCVIDVGGVGYVAWCPSAVLADLEPGAAAVLWIETHVREDVIRLYGFRDSSERAWFRLLQDKVQGVGAKVALAVLSVLAPADLAAAVTAGDVASISKAQGVGRKVAERIVSELRPHVGAMSAGPALAGAGRDAAEALVALGYQRGQAVAAVNAALEEAGERSASDLIRLSLKKIVSRAA